MDQDKGTLIEYMATVHSPYQAECLVKFCKEKGIDLTLIHESFFQAFESERFKPTSALRSLCGNEWLANGMITMREAYEFLTAYIRIHRLSKAPFLLLNDQLKELFFEERDHILESELIRLLPRVLIPHKAPEKAV